MLYTETYFDFRINHLDAARVKIEEALRLFIRNDYESPVLPDSSLTYFRDSISKPHQYWMTARGMASLLEASADLALLLDVDLDLASEAIEKSCLIFALFHHEMRTLQTNEDYNRLSIKLGYLKIKLA
ncbi:hypothetical protein BVY03_02780 [bacterium K02(2017)]|nr:hypothetical protein BVY03_02780 [bacterium K02(2017)]